jgi:hypothetical protein
MILFMPYKVIRCLRAGIVEEEVSNHQQLRTPLIESLSDLSPKSKFNLVPATPSKVDNTILQSANEALLANIVIGILDTSIRTYIPKIIEMYE